MKKILFPFFSKKHTFLFKQWWFRLGIILYIIFILYIFAFAINDYMDSFLKCYDITTDLHFKHSYYSTNMQYENAMLECKNNVFRNLPIAAGYGLLLTIFSHYLFQFIFFVVIINFIYLGSKE